MIHLIDPRHATPMYLLTEWPLKTRCHREERAYRWISDRNMHDAHLVAVREESGLWRILKGPDTPPEHPVRRATLERMVLEVLAGVDEVKP